MVNMTTGYLYSLHAVTEILHTIVIDSHCSFYVSFFFILFIAVLSLVGEADWSRPVGLTGGVEALKGFLLPNRAKNAPCMSTFSRSLISTRDPFFCNFVYRHPERSFCLSTYIGFI